MASSDIRVWALKGAEQRLVEIVDEAKAIFAKFPELRAQGREFELPRSGKQVADGLAQDGAIPRRGRRKMSASARRRIGDAQRKRWAELKANKATADEAGPSAKRPVRRSRKKR
jgi:hypothetical protein